MLTPDALQSERRAERADALRRMRAAVADVLRDLRHLPDAVRKVRAAMPPPQDPVSLDQLLASRERALHHAERAAAALGEGDDAATPRALADVHELVEEVRAGLASPRIVDDLAEMLAELPAKQGGRALRALDTRARRVGAEADRLFALAVAAHQDFPAGAKPMSSQPPTGGNTAAHDHPTADAVRDVGELLAVALGGGSGTGLPASGRSAGGRYPAVADQIAASLDSLGLPHDGVQLPPIEAQDRVRSQLIDGLRRNFSWRDQDGTRTYYRSAAQIVARDADADSRLLRGGALVNANLLRAEADGVLAIMDRLPDMLRFAPAEPLRSGDARARLRPMLDQLVATASDPLGLNAQRGKFQYERLSAAMVDILMRGEIISAAGEREIAAQIRNGQAAAMWEALARRSGPIVDHLRARTSAVRDEEVLAELTGLGKLMADIFGRISAPQPGQAHGVAAGRLEELLTAADGAAAALEGDLSRFGTSIAEQEVQFAADGATSEVSLAQFIGWVRALCEPFAGVENAAAAFTRDELDILGGELEAVAKCADAFGNAAGLPTGFGGVRRQFDELKRFLAEAKAQIDELKK